MPTRCQALCQALGKRHMFTAFSPVKETGSEIGANGSIWKILGFHLVWQILSSLSDDWSLGSWNIQGKIARRKLKLRVRNSRKKSQARVTGWESLSNYEYKWSSTKMSEVWEMECQAEKDKPIKETERFTLG